MWGRESGTSKYVLEYSSKPGSKWGNLKLALNMALNPAPKWAPNWISRYGFRVAPNLLFEWGLHASISNFTDNFINCLQMTYLQGLYFVSENSFSLL